MSDDRPTLPSPRPLTSPDPESIGYVQAIWDEHCVRRRSQFPLASSAEYSLAMSWFEEGIPLRIVLRGFADAERVGSSLFYYREPVRRAFEMWRKNTA